MTSQATKRQKEEVKPRIQALLFEALEADGSNYLEWSNDAKAYLVAEELDGTLKTPAAANIPVASQWKALLILRRHLDYSLRKQYIHINKPDILWTQLEELFSPREDNLFTIG